MTVIPYKAGKAYKAYKELDVTYSAVFKGSILRLSFKIVAEKAFVILKNTTRLD